MSLKTIAAAALLTLGLASPAFSAGETVAPPSNDWSWQGAFGTFDKAQLQRGYKVYKTVCSACHAMNLLYFRNLAQDGGPGFTVEQAEVLAAEFMIEDPLPDDTGAMFERPGQLTDRFPSPFPNERAARASNGGAYPLDLSVIAKARPNGPDYIKALLTGYVDPPPLEEGETAPVGKYYNTYYPGHWISMAPPLADDLVEYTDETPMTAEQYAEDLSAFFMWAAEPKLEERKSVGFVGMILLVVLASLLFATTRTVWAGVKH